MCRHLAHLGDARSLAAVLTEGPTSLYRQSYEPRHQRHGNVNADGWGVGWFAEPTADVPARHRSARPIWADSFVADVAPHIRSGCVVAAVRSATPPAPIEESGAAPFTDGRLLFSHNGAVTDFADQVGPILRRTLDPQVEGSIRGASDSEVLFACLRQAGHLGAELPDAVAQTVHAVLALTMLVVGMAYANVMVRSGLSGEQSEVMWATLAQVVLVAETAVAGLLLSSRRREGKLGVSMATGALLVVQIAFAVLVYRLEVDHVALTHTAGTPFLFGMGASPYWIALMIMVWGAGFGLILTALLRERDRARAATAAETEEPSEEDSEATEGRGRYLH